MRQAAIAFETNGVTLEGIITTPDDAPSPYPAIVVCHPHPMLGGNMGNPVVFAICQAAAAEGIASLRFDFRGVGDSQGTFTNGKDEWRDLKSALDVITHWPGVDGKRVAIVGYSLGASIILNGFKNWKPAKAFALIAPPVSALKESKIKQDDRPKLFVVGQNDRVAPSVELQREIDEMQKPVNFREIPNADHTLNAHEPEVSKEVVAFVKEALSA